MGSYFSQDSGEVDPLTGLSGQELALVQRSWRIINADPIASGAHIFIKLFKAHPETREFFRMVAHVADEDLPTNVQFKAHVLFFMTSFNLVVANLHQPEIVAANLNKLGTSHRKRRIGEKHFLDLKDMMVNDILRNDLKQDEPTVAAWGKTLDFMNKHIFETLNSAEARD